MDTSKPIIDFSLLNERLEKLVKATIERIDREWPPSLGKAAHAVPFHFMLKHAWWVYRAARFLIADIPKDPLRRPEFAVGLAPLSRTVLDLVFNVIFIFDDYPQRLCWYLNSGLEEKDAMYKRYLANYRSDPTWAEWLAKMPLSIDDVFAQRRDEVCGTGVVVPNGRFPHPGAILSQQRLNDPALKSILTYLNDWAYRQLSQTSHGQWAGLVDNMGPILWTENGSEEDSAMTFKFRSDGLLQMMTFLLCLTCEIVVKADFGGKEDAMYVWGLLSPMSDDAKYLLDNRYRALLA